MEKVKRYRRHIKGGKDADNK